MASVYLIETPPRKMVSIFNQKFKGYFLSSVYVKLNDNVLQLLHACLIPLDNCVHGDSMKPFPNNGTCAELVANRPSRCYNREYREFCCGSCNAKFTGKKGKNLTLEKLCYINRNENSILEIQFYSLKHKS